MIPTDLLRSPQQAIAARLSQADASWPIAFASFFFLSAAEEPDRFSARFPNLGLSASILLTLVLAALLGAWIAAGVYGGVLHIGARVLGGRHGVRDSIRAVGLGIFWPGLVAAIAAVTLTVALARESNMIVLSALVVNVAAGIWALYGTIAAIRVRHEFSWPRAAAAWVLPVLLFGALGVAIALAHRS